MFKDLKSDFSASVVVFFVALPLCLGIALASGAPQFSGVIAGIVGGIVVGIASKSPLGVSGPGNGLSVLVLAAVSGLGSWSAFLVSVVLAGCIQLVMGYAKTGFIAYFIPSSVIKGMLSGIGLLLVLKQIPHALGYDKDWEGDWAFLQNDGETTLTALTNAVDVITPGALLISVISVVVLILWETVLSKKHKLFRIIQGPIVVIFLGILFSFLYREQHLAFSLSQDQVVNIPVAENSTDFIGQFTFPDFSAIGNLDVWAIALQIALIASLETLLSVEAADKLDPFKRVTPTDRELKAQGLGNIVSGLLGGLPVTQVIVRSSVNIAFGAKSKLSTILHGLLILISVLSISNLLNMIPLASLAAILIVVGYKLFKPKEFVQMYRMGDEQFVPFAATVLGLLLTDLLYGIGIGLLVGVFYTLRHSYRNAYHMRDTIVTEAGHEVHHIVLAEEVTFFNKASIVDALEKIPGGSKVIIDCSRCKAIAFDVVEAIRNFQANAALKAQQIETVALNEHNGVIASGEGVC